MFASASPWPRATACTTASTAARGRPLRSSCCVCCWSVPYLKSLGLIDWAHLSEAAGLLVKEGGLALTIDSVKCEIGREGWGRKAGWREEVCTTYILGLLLSRSRDPSFRRLSLRGLRFSHSRAYRVVGSFGRSRSHGAVWVHA